MATVLLLEDERDVAELITEILVDGGHRVILARHGEEALAIFPRVKPDVIVADLLMPAGRKDGIDFLFDLRQHGVRTPVVVVSGIVQAVRPDAAEYLGIAGLCAKPFAPDTLRAHVGAALRSSFPAADRLRCAAHLTAGRGAV